MATAAKLALLTPLHSRLSKEFPLFNSTMIRPKLSDSSFPQFNKKLKQVRNAPIVPLVRAQGQSSPEYIPDAKFYKVEAILRCCHALASHTSFLGFGAQGGSTERHGGSEFSEDKFVAKVKMEIVVSKDQVEAVIDHRGGKDWRDRRWQDFLGACFQCNKSSHWGGWRQRGKDDRRTI